MIDVVVLAAGRGERLGALGQSEPKWLLKVGDTTPAERQLDAIGQVMGQSPRFVRSIHVVAGHASPAIARFVAGRPDSEISLVENPYYDTLNNWYSLLLALRALDAKGSGERIVVFNGDLLAGAQWFAGFLRDSGNTRSEALIAVDTARPLTEESMKVSVAEHSPERLGTIGKVGVGEPVGEYVGMFMARGAARDRLKAALETYVESDGAANYWYEQAIGETAAAGIDWVIWPTPDSNWIEIDDEADYLAAQKMDLR